MMKYSILIQEPIINHVWIHNTQLSVLNQNVILLQILTGRQLLRITALIMILVLDGIVVAIGLLLQSLVFIQEFGRG